jgi:dTDP-4-dehydrorhamnose reductase
MEKILIIGASGLLGNKVYELAKQNYIVYGTYLTHPIKDKNMFRLDVTKKSDILKLFEKIKPDLVIDTHSITNVDYCETHKDEAWFVNVDGTRNVAEACRIYSAKMIFISTDYVFDGKKLEYCEKDKPNPLNYYGKTKAIAEKVLDLLDVNHITIRSAVLYGKGGLGKKPFPIWVIENLRAGKEIRVVVDQFNNPTFVDDLAKILLELWKKDVNGLFHAVGKKCINRYEFAIKTAEVFGLNKKLIRPITTPELNQIAIRPRKLNLLTKKLERVMGRKLIGVEEALKILREQGV